MVHHCCPSSALNEKQCFPNVVYHLLTLAEFHTQTHFKQHSRIKSSWFAISVLIESQNKPNIVLAVVGLLSSDYSCMPSHTAFTYHWGWLDTGECWLISIQHDVLLRVAPLLSKTFKVHYQPWLIVQWFTSLKPLHGWLKCAHHIVLELAYEASHLSWHSISRFSATYHFARCKYDGVAH